MFLLRRFAANQFIIALGAINYANVSSNREKITLCVLSRLSTRKLYVSALSLKKLISASTNKKKLSIFDPKKYFLIVQRHQRAFQLSLCIFFQFHIFFVCSFDVKQHSFISAAKERALFICQISQQAEWVEMFICIKIALYFTVGLLNEKFIDEYDCNCIFTGSCWCNCKSKQNNRDSIE